MIALNTGIVKIQEEFGFNYKLFLKDKMSFNIIFYMPIGERDCNQLSQDEILLFQKYCQFNSSDEQCR